MDSFPSVQEWVMGFLKKEEMCLEAEEVVLTHS